MIDGWHVGDEEYFRYLTSQVPPRPGALWRQLQVDARSWKPVAWWLATSLVVGTGIATSNWQRTAKGALMLVAYLWMLRNTSRMLWSHSRLVTGRLSALRPHPLVGTARTATALIEENGQPWSLDVAIDAHPAEELLPAEGGLEALVLLPPESPQFFPAIAVRPAAPLPAVGAPAYPKRKRQGRGLVVSLGVALLLTHLLPGSPQPTQSAMPRPDLFQVVPTWLPLIQALANKGVTSPAVLVLTLTYSEIELASGEHVYGRIPRSIATVAEAQRVPRAQVAEAVGAAAVDVAGLGQLLDQVRATQPLLPGLPGVESVGELKLPPPAEVSRMIVGFAHTSGIRLPRTAAPSPAWQRLLAELSKAGYDDPTVQLFVARFNRVTLASGEQLEALGDDAAYETLAEMHGVDAATLRTTTMERMMGSVEGLGTGRPVPLMEKAKEAAAALARVPGVARVEEFRPALPAPEVKPYRPGDPLLDPPWKRFPEPPTSMRWRMGPGEDYMDQWWPFWRGLSPEQKKAYLQQNPPPPEWEKWADRAKGDGS